MTNYLSKYSSRAMELENKPISDRLKNILFPIIFEDLGYPYQGNTVVQKPLIGHNMDESLDYGILENVDLMIFKLGILIVTEKTSFAQKREELVYLMKMYPGIKKGLITDGITYEFFEGVLDGTTVVSIDCPHKFNIKNATERDAEYFSIFKNMANTAPRQKFAETKPMNFTEKNGAPLRNTDELMDSISLDDDEDDEPEVKRPPKVKAAPPKKSAPPKKEKEKKGFSPALILIALVLIGLLIGMYFMFFRGDEGTPPDINTPENGPVQFLEWEKVDDGSGTHSVNTNLQHIGIDAILATNRLVGNDLEISLLNTNIEENALIKFAIICGANKGYAYATIKNGECRAVFDIPELWNNPELTIIAYLRFDEEGEYKQPKNVRDKYGENGEYIIAPKGAPQYAITYTYATHENDAVIAYINSNLQATQQAAIAAREKDFAQVETLYDAKGNIKHVPGGFSLTEANITETRHVYPMIFHDAAKGKSYFYIIAGYIGKDWLSFESTAFYADNFAWGYEVGSNQKERQLGGNACSEWVYYTDESILPLLNDMTLLANSNKTTIRFTGGPIKRDYEITQEEKNNIKMMLYIYATYYGNGTKVPDIEWFKPQDEAIDLSYLKSPVDVRMRNSSEITQMEALQTTINYNRQQGKTISSADQARLEQMQKTFKPVDMKLFNKLLTEIKNSENAFAIYDMDDEHKENSFMKFYLYYDNADGTIESGYIPYITIFSNKTVHIPLVTVSGNMRDTMKTLVEVTISPELYSEILSAMNKVNYQYYGENNTTYTPPETTDIIIDTGDSANSSNESSTPSLHSYDKDPIVGGGPIYIPNA